MTARRPVAALRERFTAARDDAGAAARSRGGRSTQA
jgi:hypothetical protein